MTTPTNWAQLIGSLNAARIYGAALATGSQNVYSNAGPINIATPFQRGMGTSAGGSGGTRGILVETAGWYMVSAYMEGNCAAGRTYQLLAAGFTGSDPGPAATVQGTGATTSAHFTAALQYAANGIIRLQAYSNDTGATATQVRITAKFLGG